MPHCDNATRYGPEDEATSHIRLSLSYLAHTDTLYSEVSHAEGAGGANQVSWRLDPAMPTPKLIDQNLGCWHVAPAAEPGESVVSFESQVRIRPNVSWAVRRIIQGMIESTGVDTLAPGGSLPVRN